MVLSLYHGILFSLFLTEFGVTGALHATFCRVCDSEDPSVGDDCRQEHNKRHEVCSKTHNNCLTQYIVTPHGLRIKKSCVTNTTCINDWWLSTRPNDECKSVNLMPNSTSFPNLGTRCSFCCRATQITSPYCNDGDFPMFDDLLTFDGVTAPTTPPSVTTTETSTPKPATTTSSLTSTPSLSTSLVQATAAIPLQPMKCSQCTLTSSHPTCQDPPIICSGDKPLCMTSFYDDASGNPMAVKGCASVDMCKNLWWDTTRLDGRCMGDIDHDPFSWDGHTPGECHYCCLTQDSSSNYWCNKPHWPTKPYHPVNMTKFLNSISAPATTTLSSSTNSILSTNAAPSSTSLSTSTTTKSTIQSTVTNNLGLNTTSPRLSDSTTVSESTLPTTTATVLPTLPLSGTLCEVCEENPQTGTSCLDSSTHLCPASTPYCMNTLSFSLQHGLSTFVKKSCSDEDQCNNKSQLNSLCSGDITDPNIITQGLICSFCCNESDASGVPCNIYNKPTHILSFNNLQTTTSTTTSPVTSTTHSTTTLTMTSSTTVQSVASTSTSTTTPSFPGSPNVTTLSVAVPSISNATTLSTLGALSTSAPSTPTPLNDTTPSGSAPSKVATSDATTLSTLGALSTSAPSTSTSLNDTTLSGSVATSNATTLSTLGALSTSAPSTSTSLNDTTLSGSGPALQRSTTTAAIVASKAATPSGTVVTNTTVKRVAVSSSMPASPTPTQAPRQCVQCGNIDKGEPCGAIDILLSMVTSCPPGLDYCMNDIVQNGTGSTRAVFKRCVDLAECEDKWFAQTSDNSKCTTYDPSVTADTDLSCHFCCTSDSCNKPYKPADSTLWTLS